MPFFAITSQKFRVKDVFLLVHFAPKLYAQILYSSNIALTYLCKGEVRNILIIFYLEDPQMKIYTNQCKDECIIIIAVILQLWGVIFHLI